VKIAIAGSVATDHLMTYPGRFTDSLVVGSLDTVSLSFLVDDLIVRRGGCAANICFGLGSIGIEALLVAAVGSDWSDYEAWLERHRVNTKAVKVSTERHTARFLCTTDRDLNQIASFYSGAMLEARDIEIGAVAEQFGGFDLVLIGPDDPDAMLRHTEACRVLGIPFAADPSQQMARMDGDQIRLLVDGAAYFFTNEYERALTTQKTGWSDDEVLSRVGVRITTHGARGAVIERNGNVPVSVGVPQEKAKVDPTGVGDAFRAGFLAGLAWEMGDERCGQLGAMLATYVIETKGTQEYRINREDFLKRFTVAYGEESASEIAAHINCIY
jgi:adenosine kinase